MCVSLVVTLEYVYEWSLLRKVLCSVICFFFQAEDGIRDLVRSRGLGDVYKRQVMENAARMLVLSGRPPRQKQLPFMQKLMNGPLKGCLLYTSDAADDLLCVDLGGRRIIKKKKQILLDSTLRILSYA